jgi:hypothetical protein
MGKLRLWLIKKLLKDSDGYTYTGFVDSEPIKFYYKSDTNEYLLGMRSGTLYYCLPGVGSWTAIMSRHLTWGDDCVGVEPVEVNFVKWIHGILETIQDKQLNQPK